MFDPFNPLANFGWSFIVRTWDDGVIGKIMAIVFMLAVILFITLVVLLLVKLRLWIAFVIEWYRFRQRCVHCDSWTLDESTGKYPECPKGQVCCEDCEFNHRMTHEAKVKCPVKGETMVKEAFGGGIIADACPDGHGVWLTPDELDAIKQRSYSLGFSDGSASGTATGIAIGSAT